MKTSFSDEMAMNWINVILNEKDDAANMIESICRIVSLTGREINQIENKE